MIAFDTNVLVRYIVRDDPRQTAAATRLIESQCSTDVPGFVTAIVLCELVWVLDRGYKYRRPDIAGVLRGILASEELRVERSELAWRALGLYERGEADYSDYLIGLCGEEQGADATFTFDRAISDSPLFRLIKVRSSGGGA